MSSAPSSSTDEELTLVCRRGVDVDGGRGRLLATEQVVDAAGAGSRSLADLLECHRRDAALEEFRFADPDTRGEVVDRDGLRRYLTKLFAAVTAHTSVRAAFPLAGPAGVAVLWRAAVRRTGGREEVELGGVDLVLFDGERIASREIYFDRAARVPLLAKG